MWAIGFARIFGHRLLGNISPVIAVATATRSPGGAICCMGSSGYHDQSRCKTLMQTIRVHLLPIYSNTYVIAGVPSCSRVSMARGMVKVCKTGNSLRIKPFYYIDTALPFAYLPLKNKNVFPYSQNESRSAEQIIYLKISSAPF